MLSGTVQAPRTPRIRAIRDDDRLRRIASDGSRRSIRSWRLPAAADRRELGPHVHLAQAARRRKEHADAVIARLRRRFSREPRASLFFQAVQDIRVGGRTGNAQYQFTLQADNLDDLNHWAPDSYDALAADAGTHRRQQRPGESRAPDDDCHRPRRRRPAGHSGPRDRRSALRCVRPAAGLDDLHVAESVPRRDGGGAATSRCVPTACSRFTCGRRPAASCRSARSPRINRIPRRCR